MSENNNLINEFVDKKTLSALSSLLETTSEISAVKNAVLLVTGHNGPCVAD